MCDFSGAMPPGLAMPDGHGTGGVVSPDTGALQEVEHVRDVFPETWLWGTTGTR